ncbi:MAG TPA: DUF309 domain-containing protein [Candidatus Polarisedimenticolia bacterium]|jgi:hypothetical protein
MSDSLERGIALFNTGLYFEAHEVFEDLWRASAGDRRLVYQGIVQACAGLVKHQRCEPASARTLLGKGLAKLEAASPSCRPGVDIAGLAEALRRVLRAIEAGVSFPPPVMYARAEL